ncbi:hypothetical protein [Streptomyces sp. enrichment culture]|uniref:hypothetical protein n=1 Tax=Streptomyces sp. enrichment culture TaxID=1795815 RepID=UPI003F56C84A
MTAPAQPRSVPTPGDLARRPRPATAATPAKPTARPKARAPRRAAATTPYTPAKLSAAESIAPGKLTRDEHFRRFFLLGLRRSGLPASSRLLAHDLMWRAGHHNGRISPNMTPDREHLALATGLTVAQVDVAINTLTTRGWLYNRRLVSGPREGSTHWALAIPAAALEDVRVFVSTRQDTGYTH